MQTPDDLLRPDQDYSIQSKIEAPANQIIQQSISAFTRRNQWIPEFGYRSAGKDLKKDDNNIEDCGHPDNDVCHPEGFRAVISREKDPKKL